MPICTGGANLSNGILVLSGYGLKLAIERGHLLVEDGIGEERRRLRFSRLDRELKRVVIIGHAGTMTLDAIRWLHGVGVPLVHLDTDGRVFFVAAPSAAVDPKLRRSQAVAAETGLGLRLSRELVQAKIEAQRQLFARIAGSSVSPRTIDSVLRNLSQATSGADIRNLEAIAAKTYWGAWRTIPIRFTKRDAALVPRHWRSYDSRTSALASSRSPRKATNPANAVLNYLYAVLEAEMRIAALSVGLDPVLGLLHRDERCRDSLVLDLMEPVRPAVDAFVLDFLAQHTFTRDELFECLDGQCRLLPPLTEQLAVTAPRWARLALPEAQRLAGKLLDAEQADAACDRQPAGAKGRSRRAGRPRGARNVVVREYTGTNQRWDPTVRTKRRRTMKRVIAANRAWSGPSAAPSVFRKEILPGLRDVRLTEIEQVTGLSSGACSRIRSGKSVPHPRHWEALADLAETGVS
jgi:CRISPR-associated endonuclease Cas1